jgi:uncharacterized protein YihD (DUF1040 family)
MRDPERIDPTIELIREVWKKNPDQRLGQLICNISRYGRGNTDPWIMEDHLIPKGIEEMEKKMDSNG